MLTMDKCLWVLMVLFFQLFWMFENFQDKKLRKSFSPFFSCLFRTIYTYAISQRESICQNMSEKLETIQI